MSPDTDAAPAVGPLLPILATIGWIITGAILLIPALFSPMLAAGGFSIWSTLLLVGLLSSPVLCFLSTVGSWLIWGTTRQHRGGAARTFRGIIYLLPLIGILTAFIGYAGIELICSGELDCVP
jgi:hypothetical protein